MTVIPSHTGFYKKKLCYVPENLGSREPMLSVGGVVRYPGCSQLQQSHDSHMTRVQV